MNTTRIHAVCLLLIIVASLLIPTAFHQGGAGRNLDNISKINPDGTVSPYIVPSTDYNGPLVEFYFGREEIGLHGKLARLRCWSSKVEACRTGWPWPAFDFYRVSPGIAEPTFWNRTYVVHTGVSERAIVPALLVAALLRVLVAGRLPTGPRGRYAMLFAIGGGLSIYPVAGFFDLLDASSVLARVFPDANDPLVAGLFRASVAVVCGVLAVELYPRIAPTDTTAGRESAGAEGS